MDLVSRVYRAVRVLSEFRAIRAIRAAWVSRDLMESRAVRVSRVTSVI